MKSRFGFISALLMVGCQIVAAIEVRAADEKPVPSFADVTEIVQKHFAKQRGYTPGDLITQSDADAAFKKLKAAGWEPEDAKKIRGSLVADNSLLARELRTPSGRAFVRPMAGNPQAFDRLERLTMLPDGASIIQRLVAGPDGYKLLEYMTSSSGGLELGRQLSNAPAGHNFNDPTGHIYTEEQFLARLRQSYPAAAKSSAKNSPTARGKRTGSRPSLPGAW
jgi:hypothetical protein